MIAYIEIETSVGEMLVNLNEVDCISKKVKDGTAVISFAASEDTLNTKESYSSLKEKIESHSGFIHKSSQKPDLNYVPSSSVKTTDERKHGQWIQHPFNKDYYQCSECGCCWEKKIVDNCNMNFCTSCGAIMNEGEQNG